MTTLPIKRETLAKLCEHREKCRALYREAVELLKQAETQALLASPTDPYVWASRTEFEKLQSWHGRSGFVDVMDAKLDRSMWRHAIKASTLGDLMDAKAKEEFLKSLKENPPEASFENVFATLSTLAGTSGQMMTRGVVELFIALDNRYCMNKSFRINNRIKISGAMVANDRFGNERWNHYSKGRDQLVDLERMILIAEGQKPSSFDNNIAALVDEGMRHGIERFVSNDYLFVRWFKNGNVDVTILKQSSVDALNRIIAHHFGETIADDSK